MGFGEDFKQMIWDARDQNLTCLLGTVGPDGPNISPKSSIVILDDDHLAYWERSRLKALENLRFDQRVVVFYWNQQAFEDGRLKHGIVRFYGTAELHESGPVYDLVKSRMNRREIEHAGGAEGIAVRIKLDRAIDLRGNSMR